MLPVIVVAAVTFEGGLGSRGQIPWRVKADLQWFEHVTCRRRSAVVFGRKTWEGLPPSVKEDSRRRYIVISRDFKETGVTVVRSYTAALEAAGKLSVEQIVIAGGAQIYAEALQHSSIDTIYLTRLGRRDGEFLKDKMDTFMPPIPVLDCRDAKWAMTPFANHPAGFKLVGISSTVGNPKGSCTAFDVVTLVRVEQENEPLSREGQASVVSAYLHPPPKPCALTPCLLDKPEECQYLDLIAQIIQNGAFEMDRTKVGTFAQFGHTSRFSLRGGVFPLLTSKRVFWRGVAEELLWFVRGETNARLLQEKNIHIWDDNSSREYLDSIGLPHREEGDLGPVYGFQWRHFGAQYDDVHADYTSKGFDQLKSVIETIKVNPTDRRLIVSAWNPAALKEMALPPCHMFCQFHVDVEKGELSCAMYQRSCDLGLGVPFNIASYSLLLRMVAAVTGYEPGDFFHVMGNTHVYRTHVEALKEQLQRLPRPFPLLNIKRVPDDVENFCIDDFEIIGYNPQPKIVMKMAV
ncbi:MAG: uncharacterized protein KVP18_003866 [Porospora cf. gigantea A]|uniref:uncharacterized protein n=1 Tax=Porospora cf. gigantea A TaxID=2853593 RepID=UPI003559A589|nr:MAG: hypothetical protein KVP18_003866 [Porospora cf. gigantea A]